VSTGILCALRGELEATVVRGLDGAPGLEVTRRCADLAELLASGAAGLGAAAVVGSSLAGLDRAAVRHLQASGVHVVLVDLDALPGEADGTGLGADLVLPVADVGDVVAHLRALLAEVERTGRRPGQGGAVPVVRPSGAPHAGPAAVGGADPSGPPGGGTAEGPTSRPPVGVPSAPGVVRPDPSGLSPGGRPGRIVAVWGPTGAPGRTTLAVTLAAELAGRRVAHGRDVLLVDADTYGGAVGAVLGLLDEAPGIAAAVRAATDGRLDLVGLAGMTPVVQDGLRVLTGISRAARWPEITEAGLEVLWPTCRRLADTTVVDTGFCLEEDELLSYDTRAPRRNGATTSALAAADVVVVVGAGDPLGLQRLVRGLGELAERTTATGSGSRRVVVVNRVRATAAGPRPDEAVRDALRRYAGLDDVHVLPDDPAACDAALLAGRSVVEHAPPTTPLRRAVARLADAVLAGAPAVGAH
jgi:MinD-like ATPase involved in chromosome partitioning or flagellar assembly